MNRGVGIGAYLAAGLILAFSNAASACKPDDFEILKYHQVDNGAFFNVLGELVNHCPEAAGVQLQVVVKDTKGNLMETENPWPASTRNIAPDEVLPFELMYNNFPGEKIVSIKPTGVENWAKIAH